MLNAISALVLVLNLLASLYGNITPNQQRQDIVITTPANSPEKIVDFSAPCTVSGSKENNDGTWTASIDMGYGPDVVEGWGFGPFDGNAICHTFPTKYILEGNTIFYYGSPLR